MHTLERFGFASVDIVCAEAEDTPTPSDCLTQLNQPLLVRCFD